MCPPSFRGSRPGIADDFQKTGNNSMQAEPEVSMRGGGAVGDWYVYPNMVDEPG